MHMLRYLSLLVCFMFLTTTLASADSKQAMVEESTAASRNLADETRALTELIGFFSVSQDADTAAPAAVPLASRRTPRAAAAVVKSAPAKAAAAGGGKVVAAVQPDSEWTMF